MGTSNCFKSATMYLLSEAKEDKERRFVGSLGLVASLLMASVTLVLARLSRRNDARLEAASREAPEAS